MNKSRSLSDIRVLLMNGCSAAARLEIP